MESEPFAGWCLQAKQLLSLGLEADMEGFASLVRLLPTAALSLNGRVGPLSRITPLAMTEPSVSYRSSCSCWWTKCIKTSDTGICLCRETGQVKTMWGGMGSKPCRNLQTVSVNVYLNSIIHTSLVPACKLQRLQ